MNDENSTLNPPWIFCWYRSMLVDLSSISVELCRSRSLFCRYQSFDLRRSWSIFWQFFLILVDLLSILVDLLSILVDLLSISVKLLSISVKLLSILVHFCWTRLIFCRSRLNFCLSFGKTSDPQTAKSESWWALISQIQVLLMPVDPWWTQWAKSVSCWVPMSQVCVLLSVNEPNQRANDPQWAQVLV